MRRRSVPLLILIMLAAMPGFVWAQPGLRIRVDDFKSNFPKLQADIRIIDPATGRDVTGLSARDVIILQDGVELKNPSTRVTTFTTSPERPVLPFGNMQLRSGGAVIGIVLDLSTLLNDPGDPHTDYNARAKEVVRWWLEAGRNVAPADPELISIFQPATRLGNEPLQPEALASFVNDRNLVMMTMEQLVPRRGATFLYDAVLAAINATAHRARERGTDAYVLIVSDGGSDPASDDLLSAINTASGGGFDRQTHRIRRWATAQPEA
ncbi:MAG: hypothetical protein KatS3mg057_2878 [Herpetosiphonaceae bacterium]|nr:MAG: hypothetical protein KatS3mg057_2878 [Herpetosiphonaceae bacterium]